jgi:hypothetical protein
MVSSGTKLVPPLLLGGPPAAPLLLRVTLGSDDVLTVTAFERLKKFEMPFLPFPGGWIQLGPPPPPSAP